MQVFFPNLTLNICIFIILSTVVSNVALNKPAKQSSTFTSGVTYSANLAVDGNNGTDFFVDKCSHTANGDTNPWWLVDLQADYFIKSVRIFNRGMDSYGIGKRPKSRHFNWNIIKKNTFNFVLSNYSFKYKCKGEMIKQIHICCFVSLQKWILNNL